MVPTVKGLAAPASLWLLLVAAAGCGSDGEPDTPPDAGDPALVCDGEGTGQGDAFELRLGLAAPNDGFVELVDGDSCPVVTGAQGLLMLITELRADIETETDAICMFCSFQVAPIGEFDGASLSGSAVFRDDGIGELRSQSIIILGPAPQVKPILVDADVQLSLACDGHGRGAAIERALHLTDQQ